MPSDSRISFSWSPEGRWLAVCVAESVTDWDVPVGAPTPRDWVSLHDGHTGAELWSKEVSTTWAPFEWTPDGRLEAAERLWDPVTGEPEASS
jgi:hypothetical protein